MGWAALGLVTFFVVSAIYAAMVQPDAEQTTVQDLGGDQGTVGLVVAGLMVIVVAPVVEEIFFRGFFYRALRTRLGVLLAAAIDGVVFGFIHFQFDGADGLLILPPLMLLGFVYCLVYEKTGSLFPVIGLHAFNNALAYGGPGRRRLAGVGGGGPAHARRGGARARGCCRARPCPAPA